MLPTTVSGPSTSITGSGKSVAMTTVPVNVAHGIKEEASAALRIVVVALLHDSAMVESASF